MKKSEFVVEVAKKTGLSQAKTGELVNAVLEVITETLKAGDKVTLTGFGSFEVRERAARMETNIRTKEKTQSPASKHPAFTAGAVLKDAIHPKPDQVKAEAKAKRKTKEKSAS